MSIKRWLRLYIFHTTVCAAVQTETNAILRPDTSVGSVTAVLEFELLPVIEKPSSAQQATTDPLLSSREIKEERVLTPLKPFSGPSQLRVPATKQKPAQKLIRDKTLKRNTDALSVACHPSKLAAKLVNKEWREKKIVFGTSKKCKLESAKPASVQSSEPKKPVPVPATTTVVNILSDLCAHGMLPIAYGMAAAGGTGVALATAVITVFGMLSGYSLVSLARAAEITLVNNEEKNSKNSLSAVWAQTLPHGTVTRYIPDLGCFFLTLGCLLFYSAFIGDIFGSLLSGFEALPNFFKHRWAVILVLHAIPILPLCLKRDLTDLRYPRILGLAGVFFTIFFMAKRLFDGSYAEEGTFFEMMSSRFQPASQWVPVVQEEAPTNVKLYLTDLFSLDRFYGTGLDEGETLSGIKKAFKLIEEMTPFHSGRGLFILMNMCCVAYACHYNAVKYFMELKNRKMSTLKRVVGTSVGGAGLVFWCVMILGYATFGANAQTLILNNYHKSKDTMAIVARAFVGLAFVSGYVRMFSSMTLSLFSLLKLNEDAKKHQTKQDLLSIFLVASIALGACFVTEYEIATVIGIVGSIFGSLVVYIFPALLNNSLLKMKDKKGNFIVKPFFKGEMLFNISMIAFGVIFGVLGTWVSFAEYAI